MSHQVHQVYQPHPALKEFVNNIVIQKVALDTSQPKPVFILPPIQEQAIFFYPYDFVHLELPSSHKLIELPRSVVVARRINRLNVVMGYNHLVIKVGFQPGGLFRLLGIPMSKFEADNKIYEAVYFDKDVPLILEQLNEAVSCEHVVAILQKWLLGKLHHLKKELPMDRALPVILKKGTLSNITEVASQSCVSIRQLERLFQQRIGLSPQFYARLVRFTKAWIIKENNPAINWTNLAYECGYFDQMHLIHDFKEFTGVTPSFIQKDLQNVPVSLQHEVFH
ncbi:MAG: helix-turn-helix transcriptional regulator [Chitinophagaceae bacterium]